MKIIASVKTRIPAVALTFDDGPHETQTEKFMELFAAEGVKATFFEVGNGVRERPHLLKKLVEQGHEIGNHSMSHPHLPQLQEAEIREQIAETQEVIRAAAGTAPKVFRAPYLDQDEKVAEILKELGLPSIGASRSTRDWAEDVTVEQIVSRSAEGVQPGDIVVLHTWQGKTLEAMPEILRLLRGQGFSCVTVSELLALEEN